MFRFFIFVFFLLSSCASKPRTAYSGMSESRYENLYHNKHGRKYHLKERATYEAQLDALELIWPASGRLSSQFGVRTLHQHTRMHTGIDIAASVGTPVYAAETGRVVFSGSKKGYGKAVVLQHNDSHETLYAHLSRWIVKPNDVVVRNQLIGYVGRTGRVTGANLHFETRVNGVAQNPLKFLPPRA